MSTYTLRAGCLDYTPGYVRDDDLRPEVAEHRNAVGTELDDDAEQGVLDILAVNMHDSDFTYNVNAELVKNIVAFVRFTDAGSDERKKGRP